MADLPARYGRRRWGLLPLLPFAAVLALGGFLLQGLYLDSREIPSALIGRPVPVFDLPALPGRPPGLASGNLAGEVSLVNVFASWCVACRAEHPILMRLKEDGVVPVHGLNHKDEPQAALDWLRRFGDPYGRIGADRNGRVSVDFGVYGVPETFVIDARGRIVCKQIGAIDERALKDKLMPAIAAARAGGPVAC
jgi:cytochrome c biogenesis protein CcmG/thiol:disulfide interchange protein DsbE